MATYYVGSGGSDVADGLSWANRRATLNASEDLLSAGDTLYVGPGTYRELWTIDQSGTAGNVITAIADYAGASTDGVGGVVRITGSADDIALTRANCIGASSKNYRTFRGFTLDLSSGPPIALTTCDNWIIERCHVSRAATGVTNGAIDGNHLCTNITVQSCYLTTQGGSCVFFGATAADNSGHVIQNCILVPGSAASSNGVLAWAVGGVTVRNCHIAGGGAGVRGLAMNAGQTITVNNCIVEGCTTGLQSDSTARFTEDYNTLFGCGTARSTVTAGANSNVRPALTDTRWFHEAASGGTMLTPYDLASYSTLVELNSGTGAPSTDMRGASVVGSFREWGALEYDSGLDIEAGAGGGGVPRVGGFGGVQG